MLHRYAQLAALHTQAQPWAVLQQQLTAHAVECCTAGINAVIYASWQLQTPCHVILIPC
jgi:hypothetical protein